MTNPTNLAGKGLSIFGDTSLGGMGEETLCMRTKSLVWSLFSAGILERG